MTSRLVLNLRQLPCGDGSVTSTLPDIAFGTNSFLGNIGAPLRDDSVDLGFTDGEENDGLEMEEPNNTGGTDKGKGRAQA